jgi:hypothetical protein
VRIGTSPKGMIFVATISDKQVLRSMNRLIHPSAWNRYSANFALSEFSAVWMQGPAQPRPDRPSIAAVATPASAPFLMYATSALQPRVYIRRCGRGFFEHHRRAGRI